jgi:hypothetical protein
MMASRKFRRIISLIALVRSGYSWNLAKTRAECLRPTVGNIRWDNGQATQPTIRIAVSGQPRMIHGFATHSMLLVVVRRRPAGRAN